MAIRTNCPNCAKPIEIPDKLAGKVGKCPHCKAQFQIHPAAAQPAPPPPAGPPPVPVEPAPRRGWFGIAMTLMMGMVAGVALFVAVVLMTTKKPLAEAVGLNQVLAKAGITDIAATGEAEAGAPVSAGGSATAQQVHSILKTHCFRCHGDGGSNEGGLNYILNAEELAAAYISAGNPDESVLFERISKGEMPPEGEEPRPSAEEIAVIQDWIRGGAESFNVALDRQFLTFNDLYRQLRNNISQVSERERQHFRYFSLENLYNAGVPDNQLETYRLGLTKLLNSLSWERELSQPEPIDPQKLIYRIDLRDYQWPTNVWRKLTEASPYAIVFDTDDAKFVQQATGAQVPVLRIDWFVFAASKPPLYHTALQLPETLDELMKTRFHFELSDNIKQGRAARAAFEGSGVSQNNRLIERHPSSFGAFWISYDFASNAGKQNLFDHPLGPGTESKHFQHDGGEAIFNLPNGLQGYLLVDSKGKRLDEAPIKIVRNKDQTDPTVVNGISCMHCHWSGMLFKDDEVRGHLEANVSAYSKADVDEIRSLYPEREKFRALLQEDADRFRAASEKLGVKLSLTGEPVVNMARRFETSVDLKLAAAEFGMRPDEFRSKLEARTDEIRRVLGSMLVEGQRVKRQVFADIFGRAVKGFGIGILLKDKNVPPPEPEKIVNVPPATPSNTPPAAPDPGAPGANGAAPSTLRTWLDINGYTLAIGTLESLEGQKPRQMVRLKTANGELVELPIDQLSEKDRFFVLDEMARLEGPLPDLPGGAGPDAPPLVASPQPEPPGTRKWTDFHGREISAVLTGIEPPLIKLQAGAESVSIEFSKFSPADQQFILTLVKDPQQQKLLTEPPPQARPEQAPPPKRVASRRPPVPQPGAPKPAYGSEPPRQWRPKSFPVFSAHFVKLEQGAVYLRHPDGMVVPGPLRDLSIDDQDYIRGVIGNDQYRRECDPPPGAAFRGRR